MAIRLIVDVEFYRWGNRERCIGDEDHPVEDYLGDILGLIQGGPLKGDMSDYEVISAKPQEGLTIAEVDDRHHDD